MNKAELVDAIVDKAEQKGITFTKKDADSLVSLMTEVVADELASGGKVTLVGFGTFETRKRQGREGRNPRTGETINIPAATVPAFAPGKQLKERVG